MTAKKDLKKRIRDRQQETGEPYMVARREVLADRPSAIDVVELRDVTAMAREVGFACTASIAAPLAAEIAPREALRRLHRVLLDTTEDPAMEPFRRTALRGEQALRPFVLSEQWQRSMQTFVARVRAGIGGVSDGGTVLALPVDGKHGHVMMIAQLGFGIVQPARHPAITLTTADAATFYIEYIALRSVR